MHLPLLRHTIITPPQELPKRVIFHAGVNERPIILKHGQHLLAIAGNPDQAIGAFHYCCSGNRTPACCCLWVVHEENTGNQRIICKPNTFALLRLLLHTCVVIVIVVGVIVADIGAIIVIVHMLNLFLFLLTLFLLTLGPPPGVVCCPLSVGPPGCRKWRIWVLLRWSCKWGWVESLWFPPWRAWVRVVTVRGWRGRGHAILTRAVVIHPASGCQL